MGRVSVLQLDTNFLRIPGDIGSDKTFIEQPQYLIVEGVTANKIVTSQPENIDIGPFLWVLGSVSKGTPRKFKYPCRGFIYRPAKCNK